MPGLELPSIEDVVRLDPKKLRSYRLDDLLSLLRKFGISTADISTPGAAATRLIERGAIGAPELDD